MKILVANLGSTSFKYRLYDLADPAEPLLARGAVERVGSDRAPVKIFSDRGERTEERPVPDHAVALALCLEQLADPESGVLRDASDVAAIGFKAVHARGYSGVQRVTPEILRAMEEFADVCPAHNPPYVKAMRLLGERFPDLPLVAAFETGFHLDIPERRRRYAIPAEWAELGVRRHGFHGASHRYISERVAKLLGRDDLRVVSCHLGGSSSLCAVKNGKSVATSMGMSPQSGLPQNNRVGDFDPFALPFVMRETGVDLQEALRVLANRSGLDGLGGVGGDLRDIEAAASNGDPRAELALRHYVTAIRDHLGAYMVELGGLDVLVFTGGVGENSSAIRAGVCENLEPFGVRLDPERNRTARGETPLHAEGSPAQIWAVPTNEEIVVARQTRDLLLSNP